MKKVTLIVLICLLTLTGCRVYQADKRPELSNTEVWICEQPYLELYWTPDSMHGKLIIDEMEYSVVHTADYGAGIWIYENVEGFKNAEFSEEKMNYCLFECRADYGKEKITLQIARDFKDIFKGKFPKLELKKYNIDEYFKNKPTIKKDGITYPDSKLPKLSDSEVWISEEPYLELYWDTARKYEGKLIACGTEYSIRHERDYDSKIWIYENVEGFDKLTWEEKTYNHLIFEGDAFYYDDKISLEVSEDYKNIFGGEQPEFELVKYNIDEYFKEK